MAIVSSGAISLGTSAGTNRSISAEFGGSQSHSLSEYYRDGSYSDGINIPSGETSIPASGAISFSDFYGTSNVSPMSTTNYARINSGNNSTYITRSQTSGIVFLSVMMDMRLRRQDNYVYYEVREAASITSGQWFNTSGTSNTLSTTYVTLGRFNLGGITAIKMNWAKTSSPSGSSGSIVGNTTNTGATYAAADNTFQSVSNGQSIGARMQAFASAECYQQSTATCVVTMDVTAQKSGYSDTTLGTYRHECRAVAISNNCF